MYPPMYRMNFYRSDIELRSGRNKFYSHIERRINWPSLGLAGSRYYSKGASAMGHPTYLGLLLFKMLPVGYRAARDMTYENLSVMRFLGLGLQDPVPDHSVPGRFRSGLAGAGTLDTLLGSVNEPIEACGLMLNTGTKVDASITDVPRRPKGRPTYQVVEERRKDEVPS